MAGLASFLGHRFRELLVHARRLARPDGGRPRVLIFPGEMTKGSSGDLRAISLVPELERLGWRATWAPPQLELVQRLRILRWERPDVILLQQSRHPLNIPRHYPGVPCVFDADDADILDSRCADQAIECCRESTALIAGSHGLADMFRPYNPQVSVVWTGSYLRPLERSRVADGRVPVVTWAASHPMGYPMEAELVRRVVMGLAGRARFRFALYGVDADRREQVEGYLGPIRRSGVDVDVFPSMPYERFVRSLGSATIGLHPVCMASPFSRGKSFGKLLAYMAAGVAVVTSNEVDHPLFFRDGVNGFLVDDDAETWIEACRRLLDDPEGRGRIVGAATADFSERLTTGKAAQLVGDRLHLAIGLHSRGGPGGGGPPKAPGRRASEG